MAKIFTRENFKFYYTKHIQNTYKIQEEVLKQLITEFYRGFAGFEVEYTKDFYLALRKIEKLDLAEYEKTHLEEDLGFQIHKAVLSERRIIGLTGVTDYDTLVKVAVFTMKLGGETFKRIVEKMLRENSAVQGDTTSNEKEPIEKPYKKKLPFGRSEKAEDTIMEKNEIIQENVDRLTECKELKRIAEERIRTLENDLKIERE